MPRPRPKNRRKTSELPQLTIGGKVVETTVKESFHGDKYSEGRLSKRRTETHPVYGRFNAMLPPQKIVAGVAGKIAPIRIKLSGKEFRISLRRKDLGKTVSIHEFSNGLVLSDKKTNEVLRFIPHEKLPKA